MNTDNHDLIEMLVNELIKEKNDRIRYLEEELRKARSHTHQSITIPTPLQTTPYNPLGDIVYCDGKVTGYGDPNAQLCGSGSADTAYGTTGTNFVVTDLRGETT